MSGSELLHSILTVSPNYDWIVQNTIETHRDGDKEMTGDPDLVEARPLAAPRGVGAQNNVIRKPPVQRRLLASTAALATGLLVTAQVNAQPPGPPPMGPAPAVSKNPAAAPAGVYDIDLEHCAVIARVLHAGKSYSSLRFGVTKGVLTWNPADPAAIALDVAVDTKPHTDPIVYRLKPEAPQFLNAAQFPQATFTSTAVRITGTERADVEGRMTLMGVTKPEVIHAELVGVGSTFQGAPSVGFTGTMVIKWSDFAKPLMPGAIGEDINLVLDGEFIKR